MCAEFKKKDGTIVSTFGEIKEVFENIIFHRGYDENIDKIQNDYCLCCVDFEKTAILNNLNCVYSVDDNLWTIV